MMQTQQTVQLVPVQPYRQPKDLTVAYALAALGCCGFCGLHRFYLDRVPSGLIWLFTGGLCGWGQCFDLLMMEKMVNDCNAGIPDNQPLTRTYIVAQAPPMMAPGVPYQTQVAPQSFNPQPGYQGQVMYVGAPLPPPQAQSLPPAMMTMPPPMPMPMPDGKY
ncbi:hypothetical protein PAPYR_8894 [Paratrimastix pyriformis]|uniref:TM2 domain-containing protein n=1 Tax=Paratrimastix pyriformis TaxID=342808 RepID=A0ABQ8UDA0_9EUKA|nr:hypothetical protein PAPYR_8894 [Paratrimastix pyriformis]